MSEPSQEAKQAAEELAPSERAGFGAAFCISERQKFVDRIQQAIDTATAKAREELDVMHKGFSALQDVVLEMGKRLYHQPLDSAQDEQSSAITTNEQAYRDGTLSQPSAPTADVEKIAREIATDIAKTRGEDQPHELEQAIIQMGFAQARAPLVKALEECRKTFAAMQEGGLSLSEHIDMVDRATGIGEISRVKEGETTTTTQKGDKQESDIIR